MVSQQVLETMFFLAPEETEGKQGPKEQVTAYLAFHGACAGNFRLQLSPSLAHYIACNFVGALDPSEVSQPQAEAVIGELANMICGATLSKAAPHALFALGTPELRHGIEDEEGVAARESDRDADSEAGEATVDPPVDRSVQADGELDLGEGLLSLRLSVETPLDGI